MAVRPDFHDSEVFAFGRVLSVISVKKLLIILGLFVLSIAYFSDNLPGNYFFKERDLSIFLHQASRIEP